jgi:hypothetical protein
MTNSEKELWIEIEAFELDVPDSTFSFTDRLARENNWSMEYALRATFEYKKFIFLSSISKSPLTPSDEIDQVWHLHLLYTQSYWIDLCEEILKKDLHHGPTKGSNERSRFIDQYAESLVFYSQTFQQDPPKDIWPESEKRFNSIHFCRVNREKNWIIPKLFTRKR